MNELLETREFESITCESMDKTKYGDHPISEKRFHELESFIHEYIPEDEHTDVLEFMKIGFRRNVGNIISLKNYVGLIQLKDGFQIQILPKIDFGEEDNNNTQTKKVFLKMLRSMRDFPNKVFNDASLKIDRMNLYELFINMYLQELEQLVKRGIKSAYVRQEDNLNFFKGKLLVYRNANVNIAHKEKFYVAFDEFHPNQPENKLIKATLLKLLNITTSYENSKEIKRLLIPFEMIEPSVNYHKDFSSLVWDRSTKDYEMLMRWSKVFLLNKSFTTFSGSTVSRALLFPMEAVYESYVARQMKKIICPDGWNIRIQDKGYYLFDKPKRQFALRPDIVLNRDGRTVIMDTKWKRLVDNSTINYGISQADMYQMFAYSKKYGTREIWLLYPLYNKMKKMAPIEFESKNMITGEIETTVKIFFVDVAHIDNENYPGSLFNLREELE